MFYYITINKSDINYTVIILFFQDVFERNYDNAIAKAIILVLEYIRLNEMLFINVVTVKTGRTLIPRMMSLVGGVNKFLLPLENVLHISASQTYVFMTIW